MGKAKHKQIKQTTLLTEYGLRIGNTTFQNGNSSTNNTLNWGEVTCKRCLKKEN